MRKLLILSISLLLSAAALSQTPKQYFGPKKITQDTTIDLAISSNYSWAIQGNWSGNDGTTSTVTIQQSVDGTNFFDYSGLTATTVTGATGKFMYEDGMVTGSKLRVNIDIQIGKVFYLTLWYNLKTASGPSGGGGGGGTTGGALEVTQLSMVPKIYRCNDSIVKGLHQTAYVTKMVIADTTPGSYRNMVIHNAARGNGLGGWISSLEFSTNNKNWAGAVIRIHFYDSIAPTINDRAYFYKTYANKKHKIGYVDVTLSAEATGGTEDCVSNFVSGINLPYVTQSNSRNLYAILEIITVVSTPAQNQKFYLSTMVDQY
jgi:hypothetical protein